ncbi:MAG: xanthine dehydrogenase family protein subunit M [Myxococcales bacterium]|jgi:xanthine dehydrogenase YagS FAD-binding subunit
MKAFDYAKPSDEAAAIRAGSTPSARYIAGGTLLVDLLRLNVEQPELVIDLNGLAFGAIEVSASGLRIGALVKNSDLAEHPAVLADYPVLAQALLSGASPQIRNMASLGGNLLQRTRCAYFRDSSVSACNKRQPGSGCAALGGYSRMHAVLGVSDQCIASHPSDLCVALLALDAQVHTRGPSGERTIAMADFHTLPGANPERESVLVPGEIVSAVSIPKSGFAHRSAYVKARDRASYAFALASSAAALELEGNTIRSARVALGGVGTRPWRCPEVERALLGKPATIDSFRSAAALALNDAKTTPDNQFKVELGRRVIGRALEEARNRP